MSSTISFKEWKVALIDPDGKKVNKLRSILELPVDHFHDVPSFIDHLKTMPDAPEHLILLVTAYLMKDLPPDIEQKLHKLHIYGEKYEKEMRLFDEICLCLLNLIIAQCTERSIYFYRLNENGPARVYAQESITRSKIFIQLSQELCDDIEENVLPGQEENN